MLLLRASPAAAAAPAEGSYACPVYTTAMRGCPLLVVTLRCKEPPERWSMKGVALLLQPEVEYK